MTVRCVWIKLLFLIAFVFIFPAIYLIMIMRLQRLYCIFVNVFIYTARSNGKRKFLLLLAQIAHNTLNNYFLFVLAVLCTLNVMEILLIKKCKWLNKFSEKFHKMKISFTLYIGKYLNLEILWDLSIHSLNSRNVSSYY